MTILIVSIIAQLIHDAIQNVLNVKMSSEWMAEIDVLQGSSKQSAGTGDIRRRCRRLAFQANNGIERFPEPSCKG